MERENNKSKVFELETSLKTAKKNIKDLEVRKRQIHVYTCIHVYYYFNLQCTIDSLRVSHSLSRDVTNDTNIKTIHVII